MKKLLFTILVSFQMILLWGQSKESCFSNSIPVNPHSNEPIERDIYIFNKLMSITSFDDSVEYLFKEKTTEYYYRGHQITDWAYPDDKVLMTEYVLLQNKSRLLINHISVNEHYRLNKPENATSNFTAYIPIDENNWKVVRYSHRFQNETIICSYLNGFYKDREEKMYGCDGTLMYEGNYQLIDSNHVTESHILLTEPSMYIEQKIFHEKFSQRCGVWRYYKQDGSITEEEYEKCK